MDMVLIFKYRVGLGSLFAFTVTGAGTTQLDSQSFAFSHLTLASLTSWCARQTEGLNPTGIIRSDL